MHPPSSCLRWAASRVLNHLKILSASLFEEHAGASQHKPCTDIASGSLDSNTCRLHGVMDYEKPRAWDDALRKRKLIPESKKSCQKTVLILGGTTKTIVDPRRDYNYFDLCIDRRIPRPYHTKLNLIFKFDQNHRLDLLIDVDSHVGHAKMLQNV